MMVPDFTKSALRGGMTRRSYIETFQWVMKFFFTSLYFKFRWSGPFTVTMVNPFGSLEISVCKR